MARLMSVALTEDAVRERRKTVTRRLGWWEDKTGRRLVKPGDRLSLCRKVMGRKAGEPLVRICDVEVFDVRREPLNAITPEDVRREGFALPNEPHPADARWFVEFFADAMRCDPDIEVTRLEWRYLNASGFVLPAVGDRLVAISDYRSITGDRIEAGRTYTVTALDSGGWPVLDTDRNGGGGWGPANFHRLTRATDQT